MKRREDIILRIEKLKIFSGQEVAKEERSEERRVGKECRL